MAIFKIDKQLPFYKKVEILLNYIDKGIWIDSITNTIIYNIFESDGVRNPDKYYIMFNEQHDKDIGYINRFENLSGNADKTIFIRKDSILKSQQEENKYSKHAAYMYIDNDNIVIDYLKIIKFYEENIIAHQILDSLTERMTYDMTMSMINMYKFHEAKQIITNIENIKQISEDTLEYTTNLYNLLFKHINKANTKEDIRIKDNDGIEIYFNYVSRYLHLMIAGTSFSNTFIPSDTFTLGMSILESNDLLHKYNHLIEKYMLENT